jgi:hypothetical protein
LDLRCTQCGAALTVAADVRLLACQFCGTALVVEAEGVLFHEVMLPTVGVSEAGGHLKRFMAGNETVAGLDHEAELGAPQLEYFPFWAFTVAGDGGERVVLEPAAPSALQGLQGLTLPAGSTRSMSPEATGAAVVVAPEVPLETARGWLLARFPSERVRRTALFHLPMYRIAYRYRDRAYRAAVDAVSGRVLPGDFPAKAEAPYVAVAVLALAVYAVEGILVSNLFLKAALYLVSAVPILGLAWLTCRKV